MKNKLLRWREHFVDAKASEKDKTENAGGEWRASDFISLLLCVDEWVSCELVWISLCGLGKEV